MKVFKIDKNKTIDEVFKYLKKKMKIGEVVKINGDYFQRVKPISNKFYKNDNKFKKLENDVENSFVYHIDQDGDKTTIIAQHKVEFI